MISINGVHRTYQTGETEVHALRGVSLDIEQGEFLSIAGPSGSGKTTLLNIIGCIDTADSGKVTIDGVEVTAIPHNKLADSGGISWDLSSSHSTSSRCSPHTKT
jgi:putative ABC transport system ATP-binding protein